MLKYVSDVFEVLMLRRSVTLKALSIYQYFITAICNVLPWITFDFETLHVGNIFLQSIIGIG